MPLFKVKTVWDYCTYNKPFFILVLILFSVTTFIESYSDRYNDPIALFTFLLCFIIIFGYGLTITRDRINHGVRLPKIMPKDILILGAKAVVVFSAYVLAQGFLLDFICYPLGFPPFDLESMLFHYRDTVYLLFEHSPLYTLIFITVGAMTFYISLFFMEIALARLADTGRLKGSFNLVTIKRIIDVIGWRSYTKECTLIILAMVFLGFVRSYDIPIDYIDFTVDLICSLLIFATQFMGIGAAYARFKENGGKYDD